MSRSPKVSILVLTAVLALAGCGGPASVADIPGADGAADTTAGGVVATDATAAGGAAADATAAEIVALEAVGYSADEAAAGESPGVKPRTVRKLLRRNTLHGEVVVQGRDDQVRTLVVQRGEVTAADGSGFTVRSPDGFELKWNYQEKTRVVKDRKAADRNAVNAGTKIGVGGVRDSSSNVARLIIVG